MERNPVLETAHKGALAYIGALALTGDTIVSTIDTFTKQGEKVWQQYRSRQEAVASRADEELAERQKAVEARFAQLREELEHRREQLMDALNIPTYSTVMRLNEELARLTGEVEALSEEQRRRKVAKHAPKIERVEPVPGYDKLNVDQVIDLLPSLDKDQIRAVRDYEQHGANRVTVLRAIERQMVNEDPPSRIRPSVEPLPRYNELTVEEIEVRLPALNEAELRHVLAYEQEYKARKSVLEMIEERLAVKREG